tara:strand:+ start:110 stop:355 length:246 start_codon:yes stop_codon:yes gene_type:complete
MAQRWLHYGCSKGVLQNLQAEASGCSGRINLAETLKLSDVVIALNALEGIQKSIEIRPSQLTVLLPFHGAGIGSQCWVSRI